jgi:hypothetical protein
VRGPPQSPAAQSWRQQAEDLLGARFHVFGDVDDVARRRPGLAGHPREAGRAQFELGNTHHVLDAHAHGEVARQLGDEDGIRAVTTDEAFDMAEIALGVSRILVVGEALGGLGQDGVGFERKD